MVELCRGRGIKLKSKPDRRDEMTGRCPFHRDRDSSFVVIPGKNLFYCTHCRTGGGALDFVVKAEGCDYRVAAEKLLATLPVKEGYGHAANT